MLNDVFQGVFDSQTTSVISATDFLICVLAALGVGIILAAFYMYKNRYSKGFVVTLATMPAIVCVIIMMVNGNVGTGVAVAGAFSLVRFRSAPGSAREIAAIFLAMGSGLVVGMGYIGYAFLIAIILGAVNMLLNAINLGNGKREKLYKTLNITIPEDLNYENVFEPIISEYASQYELMRVKTTNMGSLFKLNYNITMKEAGKEKEMLDKLRCRNGNLEISLSKQETVTGEL